MSAVPDRSEIDEAYTWDLEAIFEDDDAWEAEFEAVSALADEMAEFEGRVGESGETLLAALERRDELFRRLSTLVSYSRMRRDEDTRRDHYQGLTARANALASRAGGSASFLEPEIQALDPDRLVAWLDEVEGLEPYAHFLDDVVRRRPHTRSAEVEELLADLSNVLDAPGDIYTIFHNADLAFPDVDDPSGEPVELTQNTFVTLLKRPDRDFRRRVYETYYDRWGEYRNTVATAYRNVLEREAALAEARDFEDAGEMHLFDPNVPTAVYDRLVDTVADNLDPLHRHVELKRRVLGVDELRMWDLYVPLSTGADPEVPYEDAVSYVVEALGALGDAYRDRVAAGIESRWVDVYENRGKRGGAYSGGTYDTQPYILMNYQDDVESMYTLAHELGHSLHSEYTSERQPYVYADYSLFLAEVASTVNEVLLTNHLLETVDDPSLRLRVLDASLERFRTVLYRQTLFADFERRVHDLATAGEAVTADRLDGTFRGRKAAYYEPAALDDRIDREWMRIPHFYRPFYVFQYSTGISAAVAIAADVIERGEPAARRYRDFLGLGSSDYPLALLRTAGVDMATAAPIESAIDVYRQRLDQFEAARADAGA
ncbi:MAG: oligoendopeptidase F [Halobacteriales archaeon]